MRLIGDILRRYPWQSVAMLVALLAAGAAEGLSLGSLLPMLSIAAGAGAEAPLPAREAMGFVGDWLQHVGWQPTLGLLLVLIVAGITIKGVLMLAAQSMVGNTAARFAAELRLAMLRALLASRLDHFLHQPLGRLATALTSEVQSTSGAFVNAMNALAFLIQALIYAAVALAISWQATLTGLAAGVLVIGATSALVRIARQAGRTHNARLRGLASRLTDVLLSVRPMKAMAQESLADTLLVAENRRLQHAQRRQVLSAAALTAAQEELFALVIALGMYLAIARLGMPFTTVLVLVLTLGRMLAQLGKVQKEYQKVAIAEGAYLALAATIDEARTAAEPPRGTREPTLLEGIGLEGVHFAWGERVVFAGVNLGIRAGSFTTLMGPSGCGKSTLLDLVLGFQQPAAGRVTIDGVTLEALDVHRWRSMIGYVPQETLLLHDTVLYNVTLGDPALGAADAERALRQAGVWDVVRSLPGDLEHVVGERGGKLSGGQRQRIMIARALVRRPRLLVLDEATSSLDQDSEQAICDTLAALRGELTILAISHRPAFAAISDRVVQVDRLARGEPGAVSDTGGNGYGNSGSTPA